MGHLRRPLMALLESSPIAKLILKEAYKYR